MEKLGLIGLPNAGKSSLFNTLTNGSAAVAAHPFSTIETSVGIAHVPDDRLDQLSVMSKSQKTVYATAEFVDIAGLVAGAAGGEGMGNKFLAGVREVDALLLVLRAFEDESVVGDADPLDALQVLELELVLADAASAETQLSRRRKAARSDKSLLGEVAVLEEALKELEGGTPIYRSTLSAEQRAGLRPFFLLTAKPVLAVVNLGEDQLADAETITAPIAKELGAAGEVVAASVQLEAETARLEPAERAELLEGLGLGVGALPRVIRAAYDLLGLWTFLTTGDKESRAWTFRAGAKAPECAGVIHTDLQRGFIRSEVIRWDELLGLGSWNAAKDAGKLRIEGKDYPVQDGDVLEVRFNV